MDFFLLVLVFGSKA